MTQGEDKLISGIVALIEEADSIYQSDQVAHRSTKCITGQVVGWRAADRREENHVQPVPKVER